MNIESVSDREMIFLLLDSFRKYFLEIFDQFEHLEVANYFQDADEVAYCFAFWQIKNRYESAVESFSPNVYSKLNQDFKKRFTGRDFNPYAFIDLFDGVYSESKCEEESNEFPHRTLLAWALFSVFSGADDFDLKDGLYWGPKQYSDEKAECVALLYHRIMANFEILDHVLESGYTVFLSPGKKHRKPKKIISNQTRNYCIFTFFAILFLLFASGNRCLRWGVHYNFFTLLRIVVCASFSWTAYELSKKSLDGVLKSPFASWAAVVFAVLYNPVVKIHFSRDFWFVVNIFSIIALIASAVFLLKKDNTGAR